MELKFRVVEGGFLAIDGETQTYCENLKQCGAELAKWYGLQSVTEAESALQPS